METNLPIMYTQTTLVCENVTTFEVCYCLQHTQTLPWSRTTKKNQNYENKKTPYAKKTNTSSISYFCKLERTLSNKAVNKTCVVLNKHFTVV